MSAKNLDNRVNRDAAKFIRANAAEEAILAMMLIYDDFRRDIAEGKTELSAEDFFTEFGKRVFMLLCELESGEHGFSKAMLGQSLNLDEMGKIEQIEQNRRKYSRNDREVLDEYIKNLKEEKQNSENRDDIEFILSKKRNKIQEEKNKRS